MAATAEQIESALLAPWFSADGITPPEWTATAPELVAFDNVSFTPPADGTTPWVDVSTFAGHQSAADIALGAYNGSPTVTVSAHVGHGQGKATARQLLDAAAALYRGRLFTAGDVTLTAYSFSSPTQTFGADGWYRLTMQISFRSY